MFIILADVSYGSYVTVLLWVDVLNILTNHKVFE
jgi:hypothetical protein